MLVTRTKRALRPALFKSPFQQANTSNTSTTINTISRAFSGSPHPMLSHILGFVDPSTKLTSYGIHLPKRGDILLIDPLEGHIPSYLSYMDSQELKLGGVFLTSRLEQYEGFMKELGGLKRAFGEQYKAYCGLGLGDIGNKGGEIGGFEAVEVDTGKIIEV